MSLITCPRCGDHLPASAVFCGNCGNRLQAIPPAAPNGQPFPQQAIPGGPTGGAPVGPVPAAHLGAGKLPLAA